MERDPASLPGTVLPDLGPSAMEVWFKRKQAAEVAKGMQAKAKAAKRKQFKPFEPEEVYYRFQGKMGEMEKAYVEGLSQMYQNFEDGTGGDPDDPSSEAFRQKAAMEMDMNRYARNTVQVGKQYEDLLNKVAQEPGKYRPEYLEALNEWIANPDTPYGEIPVPDPDDYFDFQAAEKKILDRIEPDQTSAAFVTEDGRNYQKLTKKWSREKVMAAATSLATQEDAGRALQRRFEALVQQDKQAAYDLEIEADANGWSIPEQIAFNDMKGAIAEQVTSKFTGSGYSWGEMSDRAKAKRIVEVTKGIAEQNYEGLASEVTDPTQVANFFTGEIEGPDMMVTDVYNDLSLGKDQVKTMTGTTKEVDRRVQKTLVDKKTGKIKFSFGVDDDGEPIDSKWYDPDEFADFTLGKVQEFNKGFGGIDAYVQETYNINPKRGYDLDLRKRRRSGTRGIGTQTGPANPGFDD